MSVKFGPAGNSDSFHEMGYQSFADIPRYVKEKGLQCYEYQCGRGVKISEASAKKLGELAKEQGILLSVHSPYYISLSSVEEEKRLKSIDYVLQTARAAHAMGAKRIVVHSGSCGKLTWPEALELAKDTLARCQQALDEHGFEEIILCPETMGKVGQLGTLEEVMELCKVSETISSLCGFRAFERQNVRRNSDKSGFFCNFGYHGTETWRKTGEDIPLPFFQN